MIAVKTGKTAIFIQSARKRFDPFTRRRSVLIVRRAPNLKASQDSRTIKHITDLTLVVTNGFKITIYKD